MINLPIPRLPAEVSDDLPHRTATEVERNERLTVEMSEWEETTLADGLDNDECPGKPAT